MPGRHRHRSKLTQRGRRIRAGAVALGVAVTVVVGFAVLRDPGIVLQGSGIVIPSDACAVRPPLVTREGVRLQPLAMAAFKAAQHDAGTVIPVVQSYRSCAKQRMACKGICGDPNGCPGTCAPPGKSWHQLGAAVDVTQDGIDNPKIVAALKANGWCEPLLATDPGHFSFGGCH
jgi:hypothetical protein